MSGTALNGRTLMFRATPWYDRSVRRVFELAPDHTLEQLHGSIARELRLDDDHLWAFYLSGEWFDRGSEFGGSPDDVGRAMVTQVGDLGLAAGDTIAYLCDFGDEQRVDVELLGFGEHDAELAKPRVVVSEGDAWSRDEEAFCDEEHPGGPEEPPRSAVPHLEPGELAEVRAALKAWNAEAIECTRRIDLEAARTAAAATAVLGVCPTAESLAELGWSEGVRLDMWLGDAIRSVATQGDPEAALRIAERFASMIRMRQPLLQAAQAFAQTGRVGPARSALDAAENADLPIQQSVRLAMADVRLAIGDAPRAEADLRRLCSCRWPSPRVRPLAAAALAGLLERTGRTAEANVVLAAERARVEAQAGVVRRTEPRVGRNDPCPCGSGKKLKKCCAA